MCDRKYGNLGQSLYMTYSDGYSVPQMTPVRPDLKEPEGSSVDKLRVFEEALRARRQEIFKESIDKMDFNRSTDSGFFRRHSWTS